MKKQLISKLLIYTLVMTLSTSVCTTSNANAQVKNSTSKYVDINDIANIVNNTTVQSTNARLINGKFRHALVKKVLAAPRYTQTTYDLYLTKESAIQLANKFSVGSKEAIVAYLAGWIPHSTFPMLAVFVGQCKKNSAVDKIRAQTDKGNNIRFRIIHNSYTNTYNYAVSYWDGKTLDYSLISGEKVKETRLYK